MKKRFLIAAAVVAATMFATNVKAQDVKATDVKGKNFVNAGIGIGTFGFSGTGGLPITASIEHGFTDKISAGLYLGAVQRKWYDDVKYSYKVIGVRGSYHLNEALKIDNPKLDVYGGASIYYRGYTVKYDVPEELGGGKEKASASTVSVALHAGGRYMFSRNVGGFAELGWGVSPLQLGVSFVF